MSSPAPSPLLSAPAPRKRILWKWSLGATLCVLTFFMWECGSSLVQGRGLSNAAVDRFHGQLNANNYSAIYAEADERFRRSISQEDFLQFLGAVHKKLGDSNSQTLTNLNVQAMTNGTFLTASYQTKYARGQAQETFTWVKDGPSLKLVSYNVNSRALIIQ